MSCATYNSRRLRSVHAGLNRKYATHPLLQYGVELDVPAATILSVFGFRAQVCTFSQFRR